MKNKFYLALLAVMATGALLIPALAQGRGNVNKHPGLEVNPAIDTRIDLGTQVKLQCNIGTPVEFPTVTVTNNTNQTIPAGKRVYWQANAYMKGSILLSAPLAPGKNVHTSTEAQGSSYSPMAWYFK
jgi:hypothetical protein